MVANPKFTDSLPSYSFRAGYSLAEVELLQDKVGLGSRMVG